MIQLFLFEPTTGFQTVALVRIDRKFGGFRNDSPANSGHTREDAPRIRGALMARVVRRCVRRVSRHFVGRLQVEVIRSRVNSAT